MKKYIILLMPFTFLFQSCKNKTPVSNASILRYGIPTNLVTLDIGKCDDVPSSTILSQCFEGLTKFNERGESVPNLAEKFDVSKDRKTYTFYIKKGVKFHNGDELTAKDFKWTFERHLNKQFNSTTALNFLGEIVGAKAYNEGKAKEIIGVQVVDPYILQVQLYQPKGYFLSKLSFPVTCVLNHKIAPKTEITQIKDFVGTGPFKLLEYVNKDYTKLAAHSDYHNQKPKLDGIEYLVIQDPTMIVNKVKKDALDLAEISISEIKSLQEDPKFNENILEVSLNGVFYLEFNTTKFPLFKNSKLRLAIAHAIDQEEIIKEALEESGTPVHYLIPQNILGARSGKGIIPFNVEQAKLLLKEANINLEQTNIEITIPSKPINKKIAENISVQLRKNLGINVQVQSLSWGTYLAKLEKKELPLRLAGWVLDYPDPSNIISSLFDSISPQNRCGFNNPIFDSLTRKANNLLSSQERIELYQKAENILLQEAYVIPLYSPKRYWWISSKLKNINYNSQGILPLNRAFFSQ